MKLSKFGYWIINDVWKPLDEKTDDEPKPDIEITTDDPDVVKKINEINQPKCMDGSCTLMIRFRNEKEHQKWKKYFGLNRQWEFIVSYPAIMSAKYKFKNSMEVEIMAKKIVQLLEMGFNVHSAQWTLNGIHEDEDDEERTDAET